MSSLKNEKHALKHAYQANEHQMYRPQYNPLCRARRAFLLLLVILLPLYLLVKYFGISTAEADDSVVRHPHAPNSQTTILSHSNQSTPVPLEAHIMSKCPDARDCLRDLVVPAMEKISDHVNFRLSFIGRYVQSSEVDESQCQHPPIGTEFLG